QRQAALAHLLRSGRTLQLFGGGVCLPAAGRRADRRRTARSAGRPSGVRAAGHAGFELRLARALRSRLRRSARRRAPPGRQIQARPGQRGLLASLEPESPETDAAVAWGLGWGLEPAFGTFFHWGWNMGANAFAIGSREQKTAVVLFANGDGGTGIVPEIVAA